MRGAAMAAGLALAGPAFAQVPPASGAEIDPSAPLDPMPDLGVEWPDMETAEPEATVKIDAPAETTVSDDGAERPYTLTISGLDAAGEAAVLAPFRAASTLDADRNRQANAAQIDRRARADAELLQELLRSQGYYDSAVRAEVEGTASGAAITLVANPGPLYRFVEVSLPGLEGAGEEAAALREAFAVKEGQPVVAQDVTAAAIALRTDLGQRGFASATVGTQDIEINHETRTARLVLPVSPGPVRSFGEIRVSGQPPFSARHVSRIARFEPGERFRQSRVDDLRRALVATGLVSAVEVRAVPAADNQTVDLEVKLDPAPMRTIAGELGYGTGEGLRAEASWQHRNFFNPEGALTVRGVVGTQEQLAAVSLRRNNLGRRDQVLTLLGSVSHVDRDAYEARTVQIAAGIERQSNFIWQKKWTWSLGTELLATDERDVVASTGQERRRTFLIAALPASLSYDGSDDLLNPSSGFRLGGRVSPELSFQGKAFGYTRVQLDGSMYQPVGDRVVAAGRVRLGSIAGADRDFIAPSRRFYSGGGGSVRGYGYQRLGPRDVDGDPIGGRSLAEFSLEARVRFGNFGIVPFLDGGTLSTSPLPTDSDWQFGVGLGARYYSSFGPIRIDVGTPLNRQKGDSRIAVAVSLGQAF